MFTSILMFTALLAFLPKIFGLLRNLSNNIFNVANNSIDSWFQKDKNNKNPFNPS